MPLTGTLRTWNDERGFGFIAPTHGGREVFVHISAFARDGTRPTVGEKLTYELTTGRDGQAQAVQVTRLAVGRRAATAPVDRPAKRRNHWFPIALVLACVIGIIIYGHQQFPPAPPPQRMSAESKPPASPNAERTSSPPYQCDGRTHCSQMTSCAEAQWFLKHCPNTAMDGNHDGIPCEKQWCTRP